MFFSKQKNFLSLLFTLIFNSYTLLALPFMDQPVEGNDSVALLLNKYYAQEKTFQTVVDKLKAEKFDFDQNFEKYKSQHEKLSPDECITQFFKKYKIEVLPHLLLNNSYSWILQSIFDLQIEAPQDFKKYKKYIPLLITILKKSSQYVGPFKDAQTPQSLAFKTQFAEGYFEQLDSLVKGEIEFPLFNVSEIKVNRPLSQFKGTRLVLGCSHGMVPTPGIPSCPHVNKQRIDLDYTVNTTGEHDIDDKITDIVGDYRNPELWQQLPSNYFESVLFEFTPGIMEPRLLKEILRVLKPGGYVGSSAPIKNLDQRIDLIGIWTELTGKALRTQTYREVFEQAGFEKAGHDLVDKYVTTDNPSYQKIGLYAYKPKSKDNTKSH